MYLPYQMLRNLAPREVTAREQREGDEQRGQIAAAVARRSHRVAVRVHAVSGLAGRDGTSRRPFERPARHGAVRRIAHSTIRDSTFVPCGSAGLDMTIE